ncbi:AAA family ATPase [Archangium sp.]|jgi:predicted ATPase|uniref:AAA family ATPase n=1 Tax=Archangium sp. TaxID=1872627 RepID=UPI002ED968E9
MPTTLDRIEVEGFKSIRELRLNLKPLNVLIGANGAGKSNFISVFGLLRHILESRLQVYVAQAGGADALLHFGSKQTAALKLRLTLGRLGYELELAPSTTDTLFFAHEQYQPVLSANDIWAIQGHREALLPGGPHHGPQSQHVLERMQGWRVYHFHDTSASAKVKQTGDLGDNEALRPDASNLAAFLFLLRTKHPESYRRIVSTIRLVAPFFDDFRLRPSPFNEQKIQLEWSERSSDAYFNAHALSDGTLRFICLATLLLQPNLPSLILIDEPELGLHPYAIQVLAGLVRSASEKTQLILSTQSVSLVNQFAPEDLVVIDRSNGESLFRRLSPEDTKDWLEDYSLGELWEKNVFGGRPG